MTQDIMYRYKIEVVGGLDQLQEYDTCRLSISVGKSNHEGAKLLSLIGWINGHFKSCIVHVSDSLQRYNIIADSDLSDADAQEAANKAGDEWLSRNKCHMDQIAVPYTISRWDECLRHPDYQTVRDSIQQLYNQTGVFRDTVNSDVDSFMERRNPEDRTDKRRKLSRDFILEEAAGYTIFGRANRTVKIYPGTDLSTLKLLREGKVTNAPKGLEMEKFVGLRLKGTKVPLLAANQNIPAAAILPNYQR